MKTKSPFSLVRNVIIWGNHSLTQYPDVQVCEVLTGGKVVKAKELLETQWLREEFEPRV